MIWYSLTQDSHSFLTVDRMNDSCYILPNKFSYYKKSPKGEHNYKRVFSLSFKWLFWRYELLIRIPRKK